MKRKLYTAICLTMLFTAAVVMAGAFNLGSLSVDVSASARCGELHLEGGLVIPHYYNNVTTLVNSLGCTYLVDAAYWISYNATATGDTSKNATVYITGDVVVFDSNNNRQGNAESISYDKDVSGWPDWFLNIQRDFEVTKSGGFEWTTSTSGDYTVVINVEGNVTTAAGGGVGGQAGFTVKGVTISLGGSISSPVIRTRHDYKTWISRSNLPSFTHRDEDSFSVGSETKHLSNYP